MGEKPFIKFYPSDFLAGTSGLSPAERGVYITLLCLIYENDGPISNDTARLSRRCGVPAGTFKRILDALVDVGKVSEVDGALTNRRAERSITDRSDRVNSAKVAAQSRWSKETAKIEQNQGEIYAPAMRPHMRPECAIDAIPEPEPEPDIISKEIIGAAPPKSASDQIKSILCQWVSSDAASSFMAYRRKNKGKALTVTAAKRLAKHLEAIFQAGGDTDDALGLAEERGWQSVQAEWYFNAKEQKDGNRGNGRNTAADTTAQQIAFAGSFRRTPSEDSF